MCPGRIRVDKDVSIRVENTCGKMRTELGHRYSKWHVISYCHLKNVMKKQIYIRYFVTLSQQLRRETIQALPSYLVQNVIALLHVSRTLLTVCVWLYFPNYLGTKGPNLNS